VTAKANPGYYFAGFSGSLAGTTTPQTVTMSAPRSVTASFAVAINPDTPRIATGGFVQQGYSTPPVTSISSGAIITIYGDNFAPKDAPVVLAEASGGKLPTNLAGVCVTFSGALAPIFGVYATQITVQVPKVSPGPVPVQVGRYCGTANELKSAVETAVAIEATPEFLYLNLNPGGRNPIAAFDAVTYEWIGTPEMKPGYTFKAAQPGDYLTLFGVGFGDTDPSGPAGQTVAAAARVTGRVQISIGDVALLPEEILYVGLSPNWIALYQANIQVPKGIPAGNQPVTIRIGSRTSPAGGYLAIQER
jgi:uncharacterized protein (TIGR03437 family)